MGSSCCCSKPILILVNLIFCLAALAVLVIGVIVHIDVDLILDTLNDLGVDLRSALAVAGFDVVQVVESSSIYLIIIGAVLAAISLCGLFGACCQSRCLLCIYIVTVIIILASQITMVILAIVIPEKFEDGLENTLFDVLKKEFQRDLNVKENGTIEYSSNVHELGWTNFQIGLECCGSRGPNDYSRFQDWDNTYRIYNEDIIAGVPASCCLLKNPKKQPKVESDFINLKECLRNHTTIGGSLPYYGRGCVTGLLDFVDRYSGMVIGIAAGIAAFQILLIIFAICIYRDAGRSEKAV